MFIPGKDFRHGYVDTRLMAVLFTALVDQFHRPAVLLKRGQLAAHLFYGQEKRLPRILAANTHGLEPCCRACLSVCLLVWSGYWASMRPARGTCIGCPEWQVNVAIALACASFVFAVAQPVVFVGHRFTFITPAAMQLLSLDRVVRLLDGSAECLALSDCRTDSHLSKTSLRLYC